MLTLIEKYRGQIQGGLCIRQFEHFLPETEERYFVLKGEPHFRDGGMPNIVRHFAERVDSPFFSIDILLSVDGWYAVAH